VKKKVPNYKDWGTDESVRVYNPVLSTSQSSQCVDMFSVYDDGS